LTEDKASDLVELADISLCTAPLEEDGSSEDEVGCGEEPCRKELEREGLAAEMLDSSLTGKTLAIQSTHACLFRLLLRYCASYEKLLVNEFLYRGLSAFLL
jgi:hypothetical protein